MQEKKYKKSVKQFNFHHHWQWKVRKYDLVTNFWNSLEIAIIHCSFISPVWLKCILQLNYTSYSTHLLYCILVFSDLWLTSPQCWPPVTTNCPSYLRHPTSHSGSGDSVVCLWPRYIVATTNTVTSVYLSWIHKVLSTYLPSYVALQTLVNCNISSAMDACLQTVFLNYVT